MSIFLNIKKSWGLALSVTSTAEKVRLPDRMAVTEPRLSNADGRRVSAACAGFHPFAPRQRHPVLIRRAPLGGACTRTHGKHLSAHELQQRGVHGKELDVRADGGLVERASLAVQFIEAHLADGVAAAQTDGLPDRFVESLSADRAGEEIRPLWSLHRHRFWSCSSLTHTRTHAHACTHTRTTAKAKIPLESKSLKKVYLFFFNIFCRYSQHIV